MPLENDLDKILIIGAGPTLIGSVVEMDLLANDAIHALQEDGIQVVLVNPNPATVSTDRHSGVTVYLEPMTLSFLKRIIRMEEPDAVMTAYGSTTAIKVIQQLLSDGILREKGIRLLSLNQLALSIIHQPERIAFLNKLKIGVNRSWPLRLLKKATLEQAIALFEKENVMLPLLLTKRHRYIPNEQHEFTSLASVKGYFKHERQSGNFKWSNYRLTEDLSNWEEVVVNVLRDRKGNVVFIDFADAIEPVRINGGDSNFVLPALTLNNDQIQKLRALAFKIISKLQLVGIICLHFAIKHQGTGIAVKVLRIIPRLTRSAAWAMRTGLYSVGYILAKIAVGYHLNEITDPLSALNAAIEPTFDTVAIKMPCWSLADSGNNHYYLNHEMQASGEALGVGRNFETAFLKAWSSTTNFYLSWHTFKKATTLPIKDLLHRLHYPTEGHLIYLMAAILKGVSFAKLHAVTQLQPIYYQKLHYLLYIGVKLQKSVKLSKSLLLKAKEHGFPNWLIAKIRSCPEVTIEAKLKEMKVSPVYLELDGTAGLYKPRVKALYSAYGVQNEVEALTKHKKILVIGMLPMQVSVTGEFDYLIAHALSALHKNGYATVLLSNNDESVASQYQKVDRVYFEPITIKNIVTIAHKEGIKKVLLQFSGKKISNLRQELLRVGLEPLGQSIPNLSQKLRTVLKKTNSNLKKVPGINTKSKAKVRAFLEQNNFPLLVSGTKGGIKQKSAVVYDRPAFKRYLRENKLEQLSISRFIEAKKYEVTAIFDGKETTIPGIIEHLEQSGSHASDSISVFAPQKIKKEVSHKLVAYTTQLLKRIGVRGIYTLHFLQQQQKFYLLQIKPYAGHNVAFLSKALQEDLTGIAIDVLSGKSLKDLQCPINRCWIGNRFIYVKMPVFSYVNYHNQNSFDSKMKSSGSVMGRDTQLDKALYKGYEASDLHIPSYGTIFISVPQKDRLEAVQLAMRYKRLGFKLVATEGTANSLAEAGITTSVISKLHDDPNNLINKLEQHKIDMVINVTNLSDAASDDAIRIRDEALYTHIPVFSSIETASLILDVLEALALTTQPI